MTLFQSGSKKDHLERIRADIREFKAARGLDKVVVLWTANTERFTDITSGAIRQSTKNSFVTYLQLSGVNDTADNILRAIDVGASEIAPSTVFAVAAILEGCTFINGSPQNTLVPGVVALALRHDVQVSFKTRNSNKINSSRLVFSGGW
jgi:myo-inositol-1-phosphate synthase